MYAETGLLFPYFHNFSQGIQHLDELGRIQKTNASMSNLVQASTISEYNLGGEGDLFKAPEPIIEEPMMGLGQEPMMMGLDPITAAISMISCGEDIISSQAMNVTDIESIESQQLLNEVFYECKKDLLANSAIGEPFPDVLDAKIPVVQIDDLIAEKDELISTGTIQKCISSECLTSMEWIHGGAIWPNFLDFQGLDFGAAYGMRRAFSDGDIQTLGTGNTSLAHSPFERPLTIGNYTIEERKQMLSRYRKKKTKRNFGRKIKYACRKALADSQPRVRGRFAKTEESEVSKKYSVNT
ncbi:hypothetical protein HHK36_027517 [Tetracentron sinense]|uniref:CCT domain-containing protein n=1 Tax=Tetracentron sinense TaxID=13715 RepID=A0A835D148_TETSI|nr:hypothetical protein HHK36_027517 [Tetracentron sinense]